MCVKSRFIDRRHLKEGSQACGRREGGHTVQVGGQSKFEACLYDRCIAAEARYNRCVAAEAKYRIR